MKLLLIEDEPKMAVSIQHWLEAHHWEVEYANNGKSGQEAALNNYFDVIVSDIIMPEQNGLDMCRNLRAAGVNTPILVLSALSQTDDKITGLEAGADDYLAKPFELKELLARVNALVRRHAARPAALSTRLVFHDVEMDMDTLEVWRNNKKIILTPREFALMVYFIKNEGRVIPKPEILRSVWDLDVEINTNVVEVYVNYLRNKIDKGYDTKLIHTHFGVGYYLRNG